MRALTASSRRSSPVFLCTNTAIGTPQARWRDSTQSGRSRTMAPMRFSPARGYQRVAAMAPSASSRKVASIGAGERLVDRGEPLRRRAEDDGRLGAPGVRILVAQRALREQRVARDQLLDHRAVGVAVLAVGREHALAREERDVRQERAVFAAR